MPLKNVPDTHLNMILDAAAEKYKRMNQPVRPMVKPEDLAQDFTQSSGQAGQEAGVQSFNQQVPEVNQLMKSGEPLRRQYSPESEAQQLSDKALYEQTVQPEEVNPFDISRGPSSVAIPTNSELASLAPDKVSVQPPMAPTPIGNEPISIPKVSTPSSVIAPMEKQTQEKQTNMAEMAAADVGATKDILDINKLAEQEKAQAAIEGNVLQQENIKSKIQAQQQFVQDINQKVKQAGNQLNEELTKMVDVDPNRIWSQGNIGNKFSFLVSAAFGGLQTGGALSNLIQNDINAQVQDVKTHGAKANNLVSVMEKFTGNLVDASKMAYDFQNQLFNLQVENKKLGANASDSVIAQKALELTLPRYDKAKEQELAVQKTQLDLNKQATEARQANAKNFLEATGLKLRGKELEVKLGTPDVQDRQIMKPMAAKFDAMKDMLDIERGGLDPSSAKYRLFARSAANKGILGESLTAFAKSIGLNDKQADDFINHYQAERKYMMEKVLAESPTRPTQEKLEMMVNGQMAKFYDSPATVRQKQLKMIQDSREDLSKLSPGGMRFMKSNYIGENPAIYRSKGK